MSGFRHRLRNVLLLAALPLLYVPLRAAEAPPPAPAEERPAPPAGGSEKPTAPERSAAPPGPAEAAPEDEKVSLDNNLSFPVDI